MKAVVTHTTPFSSEKVEIEGVDRFTVDQHNNLVVKDATGSFVAAFEKDTWQNIQLVK